MTSEEWRPIPGYEGFYEASTHGRIRSVDRTVTTPVGDQRRRGTILTPAPTPTGKLKVALSVGNRRRMIAVSRLVGETFLGAPPPGHCIAHIGPDQTDNAVTNLAIMRNTEVPARNGRRNRAAHNTILTADK